MGTPSFSTRRLDHLGLVAGMCQKLALVKRIDALLPAPGRKVSHGEAIVAMVLNALGFVSRPLYLFPEFLANKPVDLLIRSDLVPDTVTVAVTGDVQGATRCPARSHSTFDPGGSAELSNAIDTRGPLTAGVAPITTPRPCQATS